MKATELRLGNWIYKGEQGNKILVSTWDLQRIEKGSEDEYLGIPLTEERLLRFGFEGWRRSISLADGRPEPEIYFGIPDGFKHVRNRPIQQYKHDFYVHCYLGKEVEPGAFESFFYFSHRPMAKGIQLEYVHQLQNLYFALTGTELELKA